MAVHPDQADPSCKHSRMTFSAFVQPPLDLDGIDASINTQMLKTPHDLLFHLEALYNGINPEIGILKKDKVDIFQNAAQRVSKQSSWDM